MRGTFWEYVGIASTVSVVLALYLVPIPRTSAGNLELAPCPIIVPAVTAPTSYCASSVQVLASGSAGVIWGSAGRSVVQFSVFTYHDGGGIRVCAGVGGSGSCRFTSSGGTYLFQGHGSIAQNVSWTAVVWGPVV